MRLMKYILLFCCFLYAGNVGAQYTVDTNMPVSSRPNIIFILTDDQRWNALAYSGNKNIITPSMDMLAEEGVYFPHAMVTTPICSASRASIFSGVHERTHRYTFQTGDIRQEFMEDAYPGLLKKSGYYTGFFGKFGVKFSGKNSMFDVIEDYDRENRYKDYRGYYYKTLDGDTVHLTRYTGQKAMDFIESAPKDRPFCLSLSFSAPHAHDAAPLQYFWQEEPGRLYQDKDLPKAEISDDKYFDALPEPVRNGFNRLRWGWRYDTPEKYQHSVKGYYRMIYGIDIEIDMIRKKLAETGLDKNTVIILMGDNGQFLGERQLAGKWLMYDHSIRVPLIIYDPRSENRKDNPEMALNIDVPATILDLAGIKVPDSYQGKSLVPLVNGEEKFLGRDTVLIEHLWEFENIPPSEGIRTSEWKYFRYINNKSFEELYNLKKDPKEIHNLAGDEKFAGLIEEFRSKNDELAKRYADPIAGIPTNLSVEFLRDPRGLKIIDGTPEFSWMIPATAEFQKGYQILVASSKTQLDRNIGDIWDSGNIRSSKSVNVEYGGGSLKPNTSYVWKVRYFDSYSRISEYSIPQEFSTGEFGDKITSTNSINAEYIKPKRFILNQDGSYFADFGKAAFASLNINYKTDKEEVLTIRIGEKLSKGKIDRDPGGTIRYQELFLKVSPGQSQYEVLIQPDQRNTNKLAVLLPDSVPVLMPFRYAEIEGASSLSQEDLTQEAYFYYFNDESSSFTSSDTILNQVWELCKYSQKATSFAGYYIDGDRERIPYEADAYLNQLSHYSVDNEYSIARKTIEYFFTSKPTWPTEWQLHVAMMMYQDYMYTGNTELIEKYYERLKAKTLMALEVEDGFISIQSPRHNAEFLLSLGFPDTTRRLEDIVDWPPESKNFGGINKYQKGERDGYVFKRINTVVNGFFYHNMNIMAEFASLLNKPDEALDFALRAARVKKSINELLYNEEKGYYVDGVGTDHGSLHANMILLAFDAVPQNRLQSVAEYVKSRGMACSVYGAQYLLEALYKVGEDVYAQELLTANSDRSWYNMIRVGSTITLEAWDMKYKVNADWNHAWGAAPANLIPRGMWGIKPKVAGFDIVEIKPQLGKLTNCSIAVPTIKGPVRANYLRKGDRLTEYRIDLPANMVGELSLNIDDQDVVTLNGLPVNLQFNTIRLLPGENKVIVVINSF